MSQSTGSQVLEELVRAAAAGDATAQGALLQRYRYFIRSVVRGRLSPGLRAREETQDLEQQVALELIRCIGQQRWQGRPAFVAWLRRLVVGEVIDSARRHAAQRRSPKAETGVERLDAAVFPSAGVESRLDVQRELGELESLLETLPPGQARAIVLFHQGHTHAEIGGVLGCSAEAARKLVSRGRAKLVRLRAESGVEARKVVDS